MVAGLATKPMSYIEYINLPLHIKTEGTKLEQEQIQSMQSKEMIAAAKRYKRGQIEEEIRWQEEDERAVI